MSFELDQEKIAVSAQLERYAQLVDRDHCLLLVPTVRDTMRLLAFLSLTRYRPVHADDIAQLTGLDRTFVDECLATLQFDGFVRETDLGFQCELEVRRMTWRNHKSLDQALRDMAEEGVSVRARSGSWSEPYFWPEGRSEFADLQTVPTD